MNKVPCSSRTGIAVTVTMLACAASSTPALGASLYVDGQIASTSCVNYFDDAQNGITLPTPLTWQTGQGVSRPYVGAAPDLGAFEVGGGAAPPAAPTGLQILTW